MNWLSIIVYLLITIILIAWMYRETTREQALGVHFIATLVVKTIAGLAMGYYYWVVLGSGDTLAYHQEAIMLTEWAYTAPGDYASHIIMGGQTPFDSNFIGSPRAEWFARVVSLMYLSNANNYWLTSLYFSLFAWSGLWLLTVNLIRQIPSARNAILFSLMYFPSVAFWASGITKESLAVGLLGYVFAILLVRDWKKWLKAIVVLLLVTLLWKIKYYYVGVLVLSAGVAWTLFTTYFKGWVRWLLLLLILPSLLWGLSALQPNFEINYLPEVIYDNYSAYVNKSQPGKFIEFSTLCASWMCIILTFPYATLAGLFLPLPFEAWGKLSLLAGMENVLLLVLFLSSVISAWNNRKRVREQTGWYLAGWLYCIILAGFLAMSAPNFGTLLRYKAGILPFFLLLITMNNGYFYTTINSIRRFTDRALK